MSSSASRGRRTQAERIAATRTLLLDAAVRCINAEGAALLTTAQVAAEAGLTRGAVQHHFAHPHDLYLAVIERGWEGLVADLAGDTKAGAAEAGAAGAEQLMRAHVARMQGAYAKPEAVAALQLMIARQGDEKLIGQQSALLASSEQRLDEAWAAAFGVGTEIARHVLRDAILGDLARRVVASVPEEPGREDVLVVMGLALLSK